jgi:hypothetical protein
MEEKLKEEIQLLEKELTIEYSYNSSYEYQMVLCEEIEEKRKKLLELQQKGG